MYTNMKLPEEPGAWKRLWRMFFNEKATCKHEWRPCIAFLHTWKEDRPARICANPDCKHWEPLTDIEFFAQFGEDFFSAVQRNRTEMENSNKRPGLRKTYRQPKVHPK